MADNQETNPARLLHINQAMRLRKLKASRAHRKGIESFLSINQMSSAISSTFSGAGASSMLSSGLSELSQMSSVRSLKGVLRGVLQAFLFPAVPAGLNTPIPAPISLRLHLSFLFALLSITVPGIVLGNWQVVDFGDRKHRRVWRGERNGEHA